MSICYFTAATGSLCSEEHQIIFDFSFLDFVLFSQTLAQAVTRTLTQYEHVWRVHVGG